MKLRTAAHHGKKAAMHCVVVELHTALAPAHLWSAVIDVDRHSSCSENIVLADIVEQAGPEHRMTAWRMQWGDVGLQWTQIEQIDTRASRLYFHRVGGDLRCFTGHWAVRPAGVGGSLLTLYAEFQIGDASLAERLSPTLASGLWENAHLMVASLQPRLLSSALH
ncbi:SRPBCC family protein [Streptomyces sp. NPDC059076]|uniref:SRPBCC family protein n=1 Tax=unclassified Streptomyces TaxID=2593676 RepID=UPI00368B6F62